MEPKRCPQKDGSVIWEYRDADGNLIRKRVSASTERALDRIADEHADSLRRLADM